MPTTQRRALQAKPMKSRGQVEASVIFRGTSTQSPHYYEWLFMWRHANVQVFLAAGLA